MIEVNVICPECGKITKYNLGDGDIFDLGDKIDPNKKTDFKIHIVSCPNCDEAIYIYVLIKDGYIYNILNDLRFGQKLELENGIYPKLYNYPEYSYATRKNMFLGEESRVIPSQYSSERIFRVGKDVSFFGTDWCVLSSYKVLTPSGELFARIYKIRTFVEVKQIERLLILRNNFIPTLKEVNWSTDSYKDDYDQFRRYKIPDDFEIIMSTF